MLEKRSSSSSLRRRSGHPTLTRHLTLIWLFNADFFVGQWYDQVRTTIWIRQSINLRLLSWMIPTITMLITYSCYTLIAKQPLTRMLFFRALTPQTWSWPISASKIFSSMAVFDVVRNLLHRTSFIFTMTLRGDRFPSFMYFDFASFKCCHK